TRSDPDSAALASTPGAVNSESRVPTRWGIRLMSRERLSPTVEVDGHEPAEENGRGHGHHEAAAGAHARDGCDRREGLRGAPLGRPCAAHVADARQDGRGGPGAGGIRPTHA